jgi:hypothetical protein
MITYFVLWCYLLIQGMAQIHRSSAFSKRQGATLLSPESRRWRRWSCGTSSGKLPIDLGFSVRRLYIGGEAALGSGPGGLTPGGVAKRGVRHPLVWWPSGLLRLSFGLRPSSGKNRRFGFCFVQFREYFLCSFSDTQK